MGGGCLANADVIRGGGGSRSMLTVAGRGDGGVKFAKILLTLYVNAPLSWGKVMFGGWFTY